jgi:hypothetical protein
MPDNEDIDFDNLDKEFNDNYGGLPLDDFSDYGNSSPINKHSDLLKELTNFDPMIQTRIRNWLGLEWDDKLKEYTQKQHAIINEKGARWAIGFLQTYQTRTNIITNISQHEFKNLQLDIIKVVWLVFPTIEDFGVNSTADWYRLCTELDNSAFLVLAGAGDGKYTKFLGESVTRNESVNLSPQQPRNNSQSGNWFDNMKNGFLGRK